MRKFVPLKGYEGYFSIASDGTVMNLKKDPPTEVAQHAPKPTSPIRVALRLPKDESVSERLDELVAQHFVPNPRNYKHVHNISGDNRDVRASNLTYKNYTRTALLSPQQIEEAATLYLNGGITLTALAEKYGVIHGYMCVEVKRWCKANDLTNNYLDRGVINRGLAIRRVSIKVIQPIAQYSRDGKHVHTYPSITEAAKAIGVAPSTISAAASPNNKSKTAGGCTWKLSSKKVKLPLSEK